jgi:hypothetical protein
MNNVLMRKVVVTEEYQPLAAEAAVVTVEISTPPTNAGEVCFQGDDGSDVPWVPGEFHEFKRVNLAEIKVKGTLGDVVTIVGGTW